MRSVRYILAVGALLFCVAEVQAQPLFRKLHENATVVDGHNDILDRVINGENIERYGTSGMSDLPRFKEGGVDVQLFSIWVPTKYTAPGTAFSYATREIDSLDAIIKRNPLRIAKVTTGKKLVAALHRHELCAVYAVEGCHAAEGSLENIRTLYKRGVRVFGLTWNNSTKWSYSAKDEAAGKGKGITPEGRKLIGLFDSLRVVIDVSHSGEQAFYDLLGMTTCPIIASHSSCYALRAHYRNLTDDQLRALAKHGGVDMINYFPGFIVSGLPKNANEQVAQFIKKLNVLESKLGKDSKAALSARDSLVLEARKRHLPTILDVADHIMHAVKIEGADHVGLGSDFDGIGYAPFGLHDVTQLPYLTRELLHRGLSQKKIRKILGGNFVRIFSQISR